MTWLTQTLTSSANGESGEEERELKYLRTLLKVRHCYVMFYQLTFDHYFFHNKSSKEKAVAIKAVTTMVANYVALLKGRP